MEHEIVEAINRQTEMIKYLISLVVKLEGSIAKLKSKEILEEQGWYNSDRIMKEHKYGKKKLYRIRKSHPDLCIQKLGIWYYNMNILDLDFKDQSPK